MMQMNFTRTLLGAFLATGFASAVTTAAIAAPTADKYLQEIKKQDKDERRTIKSYC